VNGDVIGNATGKATRQLTGQLTRRVPAPLPWLAGLLAIYLIAPLIAGAQQAGMADWSSVDTAGLLRASAVSIASASAATLLIALGGVPLGYLLARLPSRMMATVGFLVQLPLALPPLASGILLLFLVGYSTPIGRLTSGALTDSFAGIVVAEVFVAAPFLIIAARSAFAAIDPMLEDVAATLGRGPLYVFFRVSVPIAWPAIMSGLLLAWLRAFGEFGATVMVAYHPYSLPVYTYVAFGAQGLPAMLPVLLPALVLALVIMLLSGLAAAPSRRVAAIEDLPNNGVQTAPQPAAIKAGSTDLALQIERQLGSFRLDVHWSARGRRLAILGPSGSGKSLTLKIIAGIEACDRGRIAFDGKNLSSLQPAARGIAYVPQNYGLFPHMTVAEQLKFPLGADPALAKTWIDRLGLRGLEQRRLQALSLGQQQRVAVARALVRPARLLLLDEPFSALDAPLRSALRQEMLTLQNEFDATTILVTHDPTEAALLADELLVLEGGRVLQSGPTEQVFARPANTLAARLLGAEFVAEGTVAAPDAIKVGGGAILKISRAALQPGSRVGWSVPSALVRLSEQGRYQGKIEGVTAVGIGRQLAIRFGDALIGALDGYADRPGGSCRFDIDPASVRVWPLS
jgi:ABC-type Fe3+/spermidine/putrescine transport system ATPase subunit/ABC-type sulfate transport system permease component